MAERGHLVRADDALPLSGRRVFANTESGIDVQQSPILPDIGVQHLAYDLSSSQAPQEKPRKLIGDDYQTKENLEQHKLFNADFLEKLPQKGIYAVVDVSYLNSYPVGLTIDARYGGKTPDGKEILDLFDLHELSTALVYGLEKTMIDGQIAYCLTIPRVDDHYLILTFTNKTTYEGKVISAASYMAEELSILRQRLHLLAPERDEMVDKKLKERFKKALKRKKGNKENVPIAEDVLNVEIAHFTQELTEAGIPPDRDQWEVTKRRRSEVNVINKSVKDMTEKEVRQELQRQIDQARFLPDNEPLQQAIREYQATRLHVPWTEKPDDKWWTFANLGSLLSCGMSLLTVPITAEAWSIGLAFIEVVGTGFAGLYLTAQLIDYLHRRNIKQEEINRLALRKIRLAQDPIVLKRNDDDVQWKSGRGDQIPGLTSADIFLGGGSTHLNHRVIGGG